MDDLLKYQGVQMHQKNLALSALLAFSITSTAQAALINRGGGLIYDDKLDITWLQDANYAFSSGYTTANAVYNGSSAKDNIFANGRMGWDAAVTWADNLSYGGYDNWRLPTVSPVNDIAFNYSLAYDGSRDIGFNISSTHSEMSYMFYVNLANTGYYDTSGVTTGCIGSDLCLSNKGEFTNLKSSVYWSGVPLEPNTTLAWTFLTDHGLQDYGDKRSAYYAWAVRSGDVAASVSAPMPLCLIASGLFGLIGWKRKW